MCNVLSKGFMHAAFTFAYESQLAKSNVISSELPPGALISFVQKGLQYVGIEAHINEVYCIYLYQLIEYQILIHTYI
jgi:hypothetical protein